MALSNPTPPKKLKKDYTYHMNFARLCELTKTKTSTLKFCKSLKLIPSSTSCLSCEVILESIKLSKHFQNSPCLRYRFLCSKRTYRQYVNALNKTFFVLIFT